MNGASLLGVCVTGALQSALLVTVVAAILFLCRRADATTRHRVWMLTLAAAVMLPVVDAIARLGAPASSASARALNAAAPAAAHATPAFAAFVLSPLAVSVVTVMWALCSGVLVARLLWSFLRLERLRRATRPVSRELEASAQTWARQMGIRRHVALRTSRDLASPIAIGLSDPLIVIPERLLATLSAADIEYILVHELAHLRRHDDLSNLLVKVARAVFIFNPALLVIEHRMAIEREVACDDWVVATLGRARRYARCLAHVLLLAPPQAQAHGHLSFFRSPEHSVARIEKLLAPQRPVRLFLRNAALIGALSAITCGLALAASTPQIVAFDFPVAKLLGVAQLDALRHRIFDPAATTLAAAPRVDAAFVAALDARADAGSYRGLTVVVEGTRALSVMPVTYARRALRFETDRHVDAEAARNGAVDQDAAAAADVAASVVPQAVRAAAARFGIGTPITPQRIPALALSYNSFVLAPTAGTTSVPSGSAANGAVASNGTGSSAGGSQTGTLDGVKIPGGGVSAPGANGRPHGDIPVARRSGP